MRCLPPLLLLLFLFLPSKGVTDDTEEALEGFGEEPEAMAPVGTLEGTTDERFWQLRGALSEQASYHVHSGSRIPGIPDYGGLSLLKTELTLQLDVDLPYGWHSRISGRGFYDANYQIDGRNKFNNRTLQRQERLTEFQEVWLQGSLLDSLDIKVGRQIVNWGTSETLRVVDVLNPVDNREPGLIDLEDLRLPITMTRLDYYLGKWQLTGIATHETRFDANPVFGSEFYPFSVRPPPEDRPGNGGRSTQWAAALTGIFSGWDLSLYFARYFEHQPYLEIQSLVPTLQLQTRHSQQTLLGASTDIALGNWLLKAEGAYIRGIRFVRIPGVLGQHNSRYDLMAGVEYSGFHDTTFVLEIVNRHISGYDGSFGLPAAIPALLPPGLPPGAAPSTAAFSGGTGLFAQHDQLETAFRYTGQFLHQRLTTTLVALAIGTHAEDGGVLRLAVDYELRDALQIGGGGVVYLGGNIPSFEGIENNDRLYLRAKYSF